MKRNIALLVLVVAGILPALSLRLLFHAHVDEAAGVVAWSGGALGAPIAALVFGVGVLAAAFLISWAAELLQLDISQNLAIALVALLAVLPEYSVDVYLAWTAATIPANAPLALANMTGANRLLIGLGWPVIALAVYWRFKRRQIDLEPSRWGEVFLLGLATVYSFILPFKGRLSLIDTVVFLAIFVVYIRYVTRQEVIEPELGGPAEMIATLPVFWRRWAAVGMFAVAGACLLAAAEPFAEGLKMTGRQWGVNEFLLIQWLAPLASEAPEFIIVLVFALRGMATSAFGALVSSKVNQWTLLVGMVPLAYGVSRLVHGLPLATLHLDHRQFGELLLTSAQSFFAVLVVVDRRFRLREGVLLLSFFLAQLLLSIGIEELAAPGVRDQLLTGEKYFFTVLYLVIGAIWVVRHRRDLAGMARFFWRAEIEKAD